ncbi:aldehyde dehydrogenase family protein [Novosphingobium bradum]|uniref:Aldehyde dehydrogenase family protein n=2 Tax=Novosphingobium bradum TaxID=1737444 RepID=A0ABV7IS64_9SPHN
MLINGQLVAGDARIEVVNPATGQVFATAPDCAEADLDEAVRAAQAAFPLWRATSLPERQAMLRAAGDLLRAHAAELAPLFTREQGRPLQGALGELEMSAQWFHSCADMAPPVHRKSAGEGQIAETVHVPLGVVCAISPWNFPVMLSVWKLAPALLAGNTIVLKPSPFTPLCMLKIGEILKDAFPAGVLNIVTGGDALGPLMTAHPGFAKVSFTGSTATGKQVLQSCGRQLKRVTLELGGNDAAIVLPDVDLDEVAIKIFMGSFYNSAQICVASKRLYVHEDIYEALRDRLVGLARALKVGNGEEADAVFGPVQNRRQFDRVQGLLERARAAGMTLIEGAKVPDNGGYFVPITIVDNPPEDAEVVVEEAFGPILPMMRFSDIDEVITRANASEYGLAGAVWSKDIEAATAIARRMETGTVWINQNLNLRPDVPFAGHKQSGFGVENGTEGLLEYMVPQTVYRPGSL